MANKVVRIGALNDESGPAAGIGKPYAVGKRLLAAKVNAGNSGFLPEGWRIELIERDHGYNPQHSVQAYNEIKDQVFFIGTSFGTPNTLPLRQMLERDNMVAFPASLSSELAKHKHTPPLGTPYKAEAMRAMDWAVEHAGGADKVKAGIIYQQDDYGADGLDGWTKAAEHHGVTVVSKQTVAPGQSDYTAVVSELKRAGANYILLTTLPTATGPILGTAAQLQFMPIWIGNTPAWIDRFFNKEVIPPAVFTNYYWVTGLPYWGEEGVEGMKDFLATWEQHGKQMGNPDFYILASYSQGVLQLEALKKAIEAGEVTRDGYMKAVASLKGATGGGLVQPVDLSKFPYQTSLTSRILKPKMTEGTWEMVAGFAEPKAEFSIAAPVPATAGTGAQ
jgi:ABC-type branched-subunit amino acid transport system substrate-binding protein